MPSYPAIFIHFLKCKEKEGIGGQGKGERGEEKKKGGEGKRKERGERRKKEKQGSKKTGKGTGPMFKATLNYRVRSFFNLKNTKHEPANFFLFLR